jgi:hypothetical protein
MSAPTSLTRTYESLLTTTLDKIRDILEDQISTGTKLLYFYRRAGNWKGVTSGGAKYMVPLMYGLTPADAYSGNGVLDVTPFEGMTDAFFDWRQGAAPIVITGLEEFQNRDADGTRILDLLKSRTKQALLGMEDFFNRTMLQGLGKVDGASITSAYVSTLNSATFLDPLPLTIKYDPTTSTTIGSVNQSTNSWWQNQTVNAASGNYNATTYAILLKAIRHLKMLCSKGPGGAPDVYLSDLAMHEQVESALASSHRNPDYQKADIPFENIMLYGQPYVWDENVPDVANGSTTITAGSLFALNTKFLGVAFDKEHNFTPGPFVKPENQDSKAAHIMWYGTHWCSNRRKQGVLGNASLSIGS